MPATDVVCWALLADAGHLARRPGAELHLERADAPGCARVHSDADRRPDPLAVHFRCTGRVPGLFIRQVLLIRNLSLPLSIYPVQLLLRHLLNLLHFAPVYLLLALWLGLPVNANTLLVIPGLLLVTLNLLWLSLLFGLLGCRFRDLEYLISMAMPLLMLLSPVFYRPDFLQISETYMWLNPISHLIEAVRNPLLGNPIPLFVLYTNLGFLLVGSATTLWLFQRMRHRIAFWV